MPAGRLIIALLLIFASFAFLPSGVGMIIEGSTPHAEGGTGKGITWVLVGVALLAAGMVYLALINRGENEESEE